MKLEFLSYDFGKFAQEMRNLKEKKGFDYLVTIVGEDFGGANHKQTAEERELGVSNEELTFRNKLGDHRRETIVVTDVPEDFVKELNENKEEQA